MNTTLAIILTIVVTNWTEIGEFKDKSNRFFSVQEGQIVTNVVARITLPEGGFDSTYTVTNQTLAIKIFPLQITNDFILKSFPGPILPERKAILLTNIWVTNIFWGPTFTNKIYYSNTNSNVILN